MAGSEAGKGLGLWPKLLLWGAVILIGVLYLSSVGQHRSDEDRQERAAAQPTEVEEADTSAGAGAISASEEGAATIAGGETGTVDANLQVETAIDQPVSAEQSASMEETARAAEELIETTAAPQPEPIPEAGERLPAEQEPTRPQGITASEYGSDAPPEQRVLAEPAQEPKTAPAQTKPHALKAEPAAEEAPEVDVTPEEAEAFAKAVISDSDEKPATQVPDPPEPTVPDARATAPTTATAAPPGENWQERRARIMAEYEAMRKRAEEEMRRRWGRGGMGPYGAYPGYGQGYYGQPLPR